MFGNNLGNAALVAAAVARNNPRGGGGGNEPAKPRQEKRVANVYTPEAIHGIVNSEQREIRPGCWVPARPMGYRSLGFFHSVKAAWMVFTGRWDAVRWNEQ